MQVLIIGGLGGQIGAASKIAMARGAGVQLAESLPTALALLRAGGGIKLVMVDVQLDVVAFMDALRAERISVTVVACGVGNRVDAAVNAIKAGAQEYIPLPPEPKMMAAIFQAVSEDSHEIIHRDPRMAETLRMAAQVAKSDASILVTGESGTGKEVISRFIHRKSKRSDKIFVAVNCAAIPDNLLESELFGHEKGAFTGAVAKRVGKFEEADGGTLLLDEISEMDIRLQAKLLRAIQEREIDRVGGAKPVKVNVRLIATSNRNLQASVAKGEFREDLFYRLNVVSLTMPALRERPQDIPVLAEYFVKKYSDANDMPLRPINPHAMARLQTHVWRGNVRELENTLHRAVLLAGPHEIGPDAILLTEASPDSGHDSAPAPTPAPTAPNPYAQTAAGAYAPPGVSPPPAPVTRATQTAGEALLTGAGGVTPTAPLVGKTVAEVERDLILDTLSHCFGNRTHAAHILGISIRTLRNKLKQYTDDGFPIPQPGDGR